MGMCGADESTPGREQLELLDQILYNGPRSTDNSSSALDWRDLLEGVDDLMRNISQYLEVNR